MNVSSQQRELRRNFLMITNFKLLKHVFSLG